MPGATERAATGKLLDISSIIGIIEPQNYPGISMLRKGRKATQLLLEQVVEEYPNVPFLGIPDNKPAGQNPTSVAREKLYGYVQKFRREWSVSDLVEEIDLAGVPEGEKRRQKAICGKLLKRMMEQAFFADSEMSDDNGVVGRTMRGIPKWLSTTEQSVYPVPANFRPTSDQKYTGTLANFTESSFRAMVDAASKQVNEPITIDFFAGVDLRRYIDAFTEKVSLSSGESSLRNYNFDGSSKEVSYGVDVLNWGTGRVRIHTSFWLLRTPETGAVTSGSYRSGYGINMAMWEARTMRAPRSIDQSYDGGAYKGYDDAVMSVMPLNTKGSLVVECSG